MSNRHGHWSHDSVGSDGRLFTLVRTATLATHSSLICTRENGTTSAILTTPSVEGAQLCGGGSGQRVAVTVTVAPLRTTWSSL